MRLSLLHLLLVAVNLGLFAARPEAQQAPSNLTACNVWARTVDLCWQDNSSNEDGFRIAMCTTGPDGNYNNVGVTVANVESFRVQDLQPSTTYWFKVRAARAGNYSAYAGPIAVVTRSEPPAAPSNLRNDAPGSYSVTLRWNDNSGNETEFRIAKLDEGEDPNNAGLWDSAAVTVANNTVQTISGLQPSRRYWFKVRAGNDAGYSAYSNTIEILTAPPPPPSAPSNLRNDPPGSFSVTLRWNDNSDDETSFRIARLDEGEDPNNTGHWDSAAVTAANDTAEPITGLQPSRRYWFKVRAANAGGYSAYSNTIEVLTAPPPVPNAPSNLRSDPADAYSVIVRWDDNSNDETEFRVARLDEGEDPNVHANWDNAEVTAANVQAVRVRELLPNRRYWFKVRAANEHGPSEYSNTIEVLTSAPPVPNAPTNLRSDPADAYSVILRWDDNSSDETHFGIAQLDEGEDPNVHANWDNAETPLADVQATRVGGLAPSRRYWFKIRAFNEHGPSGYSNIVEVVTAPPPVPSTPTNLRNDPPDIYSVILRWNDNSDDETSFRVAVLDEGEDPAIHANWDNVDVTAANVQAVRVRDLQPDRSYWFKVRAANEAGYSDYSNTIELRTGQAIVPLAPANLRPTQVRARSVTLFWDDLSSDEEGFRIAMSLDGGGEWNNVGRVGADVTSFRVQGLDPETDCMFKVRGHSPHGYSPYSNVISVRTGADQDGIPSRPRNFVAANVWSGKVDLRWKDGARPGQGVRIALSRDGVEYNHADTVPAGQERVRLRGLQPDTSYWIKARAYEGAEYSEYSDVVQIRTAGLPRLTIVSEPADLSSVQPGQTVVLSAHLSDMTARDRFNHIGAIFEFDEDVYGLPTVTHGPLCLQPEGFSTFEMGGYADASYEATDDDASQIAGNGLLFTITLPVEKAGDGQVRLTSVDWDSDPSGPRTELLHD